MPIQPIIDQSRRTVFSWHMKDIYTGPNGSGAYVPNIDDGVWDWANGLHRVVHVDYTTGVSTLQSHTFTNLNGGVNQEDILLGAGPGSVSESYRVYINTATVPHRMAFDTRLRIYGSAASYVKVFKDTNVTTSGHVISAMINASGVVTSENIPLESLVIPGVSNQVSKTPVQAYSLESLMTGDVCTAVVYSSSGAVLSACKLVVVNSDFYRTIDITKKYITGISLVSRYLSSSDSRLLQVPLNMTLASTDIMGEVLYSDGSVARYPLDNGKFTLSGIGAFTASTLGQTTELVLTYHMASDEYAYGTTLPNPARSKTALYRITAVNAIGAYTVKLFAVPKWNRSLTLPKWELDYYLYDLDRRASYNVTSIVELGAQGVAFDGSAYGITQTVTVALNLQSLGTGYVSYRHVQSLQVTLANPVTSVIPGTYWSLSYSSNKIYGADKGVGCVVDAAHSGAVQLTIANGYQTVSDWLLGLYDPLQPLTVPGVETAPPAPTHVRVLLGTTWQRDIPIGDVLNPITNVTATVQTGDTLTLQYLIRAAGGVDQHLGVGGLVVKRP